LAPIAHLATRLAVEGRAVCDDLAFLSLFELRHLGRIRKQRGHSTFGALLLISQKLGLPELLRELVIHALHRALAHLAALAALARALHLALEARLVDGEPLLLADDLL